MRNMEPTPKRLDMAQKSLRANIVRIIEDLHSVRVESIATVLDRELKNHILIAGCRPLERSEIEKATEDLTTIRERKQPEDIQRYIVNLLLEKGMEPSILHGL